MLIIDDLTYPNCSLSNPWRGEGYPFFGAHRVGCASPEPGRTTGYLSLLFKLPALLFKHHGSIVRQDGIILCSENSE